MATGGITTLPPTPEDGGSGGFPPGSFRDPKRLYCKNGGFFLRIKSDGAVDGIREKSDPHSKRPPVPSSPSMLLSAPLRMKQGSNKHGGAVGLFQFAVSTAPLVSVCRAAGGKFNGWFGRNAPLREK